MGLFTGIRNIAKGLTRMAYGDLQTSRTVDIGNPSSDFWFTDLTAATASIPVTDAVAMTYSAVWSATRLLSSTIGDLPLDLYRRLPDGGREVALKDRREYLVHDRPNDEMTAMLFRCQASQQQVNAGNCYSLIEQDSLGNVTGLMPIHHSRVYPMRDNGRLVYEVKNDGGTSTYISPEDMLHVPSMMSDDGIVGKGVIRQARESIGFGIATERYGASWFGAGAQPKVIVESPKQMNPEARDNFRKEWRETYGSPDGNKMAILTAGMKASTLNISAQDQQFLETRQHN
ncbi:MAG: phage portal protein, partial [Planctomycetales bacterium]